MEQTQNFSQKVNKGIIFSAQLNWIDKRKGRLFAEDVNSTLIVATPLHLEVKEANEAQSTCFLDR